MAKELTPVEAFLEPLGRIARRHRDIEGLVFWGGAEGWEPSPSEALEAEEIAFYAEGLLAEGFSFCWQALAEAGAPARPVLVRLYFWQGAAPPPPLPGPDWVVTAEGRHPPG